MRTEFVQGWTEEAWLEYRTDPDDDTVTLPPTLRERPRPIHAVEALIEEDTDSDIALEETTVCGRVGTAELEPTLPLAPFANSAAEDRCTWCEQRLLATRAGQPTTIPRYE